MTKFHYLIAFASRGIRQYMYYHCLVTCDAIITIVCLGCGIINFEINLIFLITPLCYMTEKSRQKFKYE